ncbi:MAG: hypothetical protein D3924_06945 [Candidatus Electrothrix sp. AR4]|nr:hypothetical protein [Candidatus Electrothrix sp. AR4]
MAAVSLLSYQGVIEVYGVANPVLFAPLLIFGITALCAMLDRSCTLRLSQLWGLTSILLILMPFLFWRWVIEASCFLSESYLVSLGLFLLGSALLYKRRLSIGDLLLVFLLTALISNAKASVGLIFTGLWLARLLFIREGGTKRTVTALILALTATCWVVFDSAQAQSGAMSITPLVLVRDHSFLGQHIRTVLSIGSAASMTTILLAATGVVSFFIFHFILSWIVIGVIGRREGITGILRTPLSVYSLATVLASGVIVCAVDVGGSAAYYFSNVAFFVSLPGVVAMLASWMKLQKVDSRKFLILGTVLICALGLKGFSKNSMLQYPHSVSMENLMIDSMIGLRKTSPKNIVLKGNTNALENNPVKRCSAKPFVFPAVSERPWIDVISTSCSYKYYGYRQYGISETHRKITIPPVLLPGMTVKKYIQ